MSLVCLYCCVGSFLHLIILFQMVVTGIASPPAVGSILSSLHINFVQYSMVEIIDLLKAVVVSFREKLPDGELNIGY